MNRLKGFLIYLISFSAGALLGDAFIHLLPEIVREKGFGIEISAYILIGIVIFFILEKVIHWNHCHGEIIGNEEKHIHSFAYMILIGDGLHNFLDGAIIASSYFISIPVGIATTLAVLLHEIPQEIGDFAILLHGGFSKGKALLMNFASALLAVIGAVLVLVIGSKFNGLIDVIIPIAVGGFIYIGGSDLIPELHKHSSTISKNIMQLIAFIIGIIVMFLLLLVG